MPATGGEAVAPGRVEVAGNESREEAGLAVERRLHLGRAVLSQTLGQRQNLLRPAFEDGDPRQMLVGGAEVGADRERALELGARLLVPADEREELPQRVVRIGLVGRHVGVGAELLLRLGELRPGHRQIAQIVARQDPVRVDPEEAGVELGRGDPVLAIPGLASSDVQRPWIVGMAREVAGTDLRLLFARYAGHFDQEAFALGEPRNVEGLELAAQALALLAVDGDRGELDLGRRELRVEVERLAEARSGIEEIEAHPRVEPGLELVHRLGRVGRPGRRLPPKQIRQRERCRGHRGRNQHDDQCATSHACPPPSRAMATRVMSS